MNFIYKKIENNFLDENIENVDSQLFNVLDTESELNAIKECNSRYNCIGVYKNKTILSNQLYEKELVNTDLIFSKREGENILLKDKRYISTDDNTLTYNSEIDNKSLDNCYADNKCFTTKLDTSNKVLTKLKPNFLHKETMDYINNTNIDNRISIVSNAQRNANTILLLYKCKDKDSMSSLDLSKSTIYGIFYLESTSIQLSELDLESGFYIARQIFYIESKEDIENGKYSIIFKGTQIATYIDNIFIKKTSHGISSNNFFSHDFALNLKSGVHCFVNDFAFDTNNLQFTYNSEIANDSYLVFMPLIKLNENSENKSIDEFIYKFNPMLLTSLLSLDESYFMNNCTGDNISNIFSNDRCKQLFKNPKFSNSLRFEIQKMFVDLDENSDKYMSYHPQINSRIQNSKSGKAIDNFIEYLYQGEEAGWDYETVKFIKERVETYFLNFFLNESENAGDYDINHILFLLPIISKCSDISCNILKQAVNSQVEKDCSLESSTLFKSKICENLEDTIINESNKKIPNNRDTSELLDIVKNIKDRRDFIFCTTYDIDKNEYNFEKIDSINRCEELVIKDKRLSDYLLSNKCTDFEGIWIGNNFCKEESVKKRGVEKNQRDLYYKQILMSKEKLLDVSNNKEREGLDEFINYSTTHFLENDNLDFLLSNELLEVCEDANNDTEGVNTLCSGIFNKVKEMNSDSLYLSNNDKEKIVNSIEAIKVSEKKKEVNKCSNGGDCSKIFNTDSEIDIILYSGEVLKYCQKNVFSQECKDYYKKIKNMSDENKLTVENDANIETMENREFNDKLYIRIIYFIIGLIVVVFLKIYFTKSTDIKQTSTETNTSNSIKT